MNPRRLVRFACALLLGLCAAPQAPAQRFERERLDSEFKRLAAGTILPAFGVLAIDRDGQQYAFFHGKAIWDGDRPLTENSIFRIYSMTKPIASVAVMQLVEQGKLDLDASLAPWLPEMLAIPILQDDGRLAPSSRPITLRQLLTHTSGFAYDFTNRRLAAFKQPADWKFKDGPRLFEPGTAWNYGTSTDWVGRLIEKVSGSDLETYLRQHVTGPLGMRRTFFVVPDELQDDIVSFGRLTEGDPPRIVAAKDQRRQNTQPAEFSAGSGLFSTPHDYARFLRMVLNGGRLDGARILQEQTIALMCRNQIGNLSTTGSGGRDKWGLAWAIDVNGREGRRSPGTLYWSGAANTYFSLDPTRGRAVLLFSNYLPMVNRHATSLYGATERLLFK